MEVFGVGGDVLVTGYLVGQSFGTEGWAIVVAVSERGVRGLKLTLGIGTEDW